jgi:hypothetical protein
LYVRVSCNVVSIGFGYVVRCFEDDELVEGGQTKKKMVLAAKVSHHIII